MLDFKELVEPFPGISMWGAIYGDALFIITYDSRNLFWASLTPAKRPTQHLGKFNEFDDAKQACEAVLTQEWQRTQPA